MNPRSVPQIAVSMKPVRHQVDALGAIARSLKAAGYKVRETYDLYPPEQIVMLWAWGRAMTLREKQRKAIILCMDHAFMPNRAEGVWNTGWSTPDKECGLNGWGEHVIIDDDGARLRKLGWDRFLRQRKKPHNKDLLFCGQVFGDAQIRGKVEDYGKWCRDTIAELSRAGYRTSFRPHPVMVRRGTLADYGNVGRTSTKNTLEGAFGESSYCAAFNSNATTQAFMWGLESTVYNEGSMLWPIVREPGAWADWNQRERWMQRMAYTQWTTEELENGTWLEYNRPIMHRLIEGGKSVPWSENLL